jgi:hypothetical protein
MKVMLVVGLSALMALPAVAQPQQGVQPPSVPKPTMAQLQKVVQIVSGDKTKIEAYCELGRLDEEIAQAEQKNDLKTLEALDRRADDLAQKIGPEYVALMDGLAAEVDENSEEGKQFADGLQALDKLCARN